MEMRRKDEGHTKNGVKKVYKQKEKGKREIKRTNLKWVNETGNTRMEVTGKGRKIEWKIK